MKSGIKTTEFWLTILAVIAATIPTLTGLPPVAVQVAGIVAAVLGALGYGAVRSKAKASVAEAQARVLVEDKLGTSAGSIRTPVPTLEN